MLTLTFAPRDRRVEVCPVEGVAAPCRPSRLWVAWPWEPFFTLGSAVFLLAAMVLLAAPLDWRQAVAVSLLGTVGLASALLGITIALVRRHRQVRGFRHASAALLAARYR